MINRNLKKILLSIIAISLMFTGTTLAAVIVTGEQSKNNDEYDQQMTVDGVSEEGMKFAEKVTTGTTEEQEAEKQQIYDLKTKIDKELKKQLEEDMAESVKYEIDYVIYNSEDELETNIKNAWKQASGTEISEQNLQNIMNVTTDTLSKYGYAKIDLWFSQYYQNNKDTIIAKIKEYVGDDGTDEDIQTGIGIVLYTATSPLEDEVEKIAKEIINSIPNTVKETVEAQKKFSAWESKATNVICTQITIDIQNKLQKAFAEKFDWQEEKMYEAFKDIGSFSSDLADEFTEEVKSDLGSSVMNKLGFTSNLDIKDLLLNLLISKSDDTLRAQLKLVTGIVEDKSLSAEKVVQYYKDYEKILEQKQANAQKEHNQKVAEANKTSDADKRKKLIAEANDWYKEQKEKIVQEADSEARARLKSDVYDQYKDKLKDIDIQIKNEAAETLNRETNALVNGILAQANITFKDIDYVSLVTNKTNSELDTKEKAEKEQLKIDNGLALSEEQMNKKAQELENAQNQRDIDLANIDLKYGQTVTQADKEAKELEKIDAKYENETNKRNIKMAYGQETTPKQEADKKAEEDAVNKEADTKIAAEQNKNKQLSQAIADQKAKIEKLEQEKDEDYKNEIYDINFEYGQVVTPEDKELKAKVTKIINDDYDQQKKETRIKYGRELSENQQKEKTERTETNNNLHTTNIQNIKIQYGLQLSPEVQAEKDGKINEISTNCMKELAQYEITSDMAWWEVNQRIDAQVAIIEKANAQIDAINKEPKYQTKKESDLDATQLRNYKSDTNAEDNRFNSEKQSIENDFKLNPKDTIDGVSYDDSMDTINNKKSDELKALDKYFSKEELDDVRKVEYEAKISQAKKNKQDAETNIKGEKNKLKELKEQNKEVEKNIEQIEKERKENLKKIAEKPEYKTREFKDKNEEAAYKAAMKLEEVRYEAEIKGIEKKYQKKDLTPEEKKAREQEINAVKQRYKDNVKAIGEKYKIKDFDELSKENQEAYKRQETAIEQKYKDLREEETKRLKDAKNQHKLKLQLAEIKCEEGIEQLKAKHNLDKAQLEAEYANGKITKDEYQKKKKEMNEEFEKSKEVLIAQKQKILEEEKKNWAKEKQLVYKFSKQLVIKFASDAVGNLTDKLNSSIGEWSEKLGALGSGLVKGVTTQLIDHYGQELVKNIGYLWDDIWGQNAQVYGFKGFKLDWGQLGLTVLFSWASSNEFLASVLSGVGRIYSS